MEYKYFSKNGEVKSIGEAVIPLSNIEYQYGFGVYETIRVTNGIPYFLKDHLERLRESAHTIGLEHAFSDEFIENAIAELIRENAVETCNLKILLIGGSTKEMTSLYILCLNPLFPDKKLYRDGVHCITYEHERMFPHAKTLSMLGSYLAYRKARMASAYEALLVNHGNITEGTRTNFFAIKEKTLYSAPEKDILLGVTRKAVLTIATQNGFRVEERNLRLDDIKEYDGAFLTSTSSKILPIRSIDSLTLREPPLALKTLMFLFDEFLKTSTGTLS